MNYDSTGWLPEYKIADHIGSIRIIARDTGITTTKDYEPFGEDRSIDFASTGFIGKEKDNPSI
jgi:hypothetical protein